MNDTGVTASETLLAKIWDTPEEDAAWAHLSPGSDEYVSAMRSRDNCKMFGYDPVGPAPGVDFEDVLEEAMEDKDYREYVTELHDWRLDCMASVTGRLRLFIATLLSWVAGWLSCFADQIGNPGVYEWHGVSLRELWLGFQVEWQMWHEDEEQQDVQSTG